jgi:hypothetical protein
MTFRGIYRWSKAGNKSPINWSLFSTQFLWSHNRHSIGSILLCLTFSQHYCCVSIYISSTPRKEESTDHQFLSLVVDHLCTRSRFIYFKGTVDGWNVKLRKLIKTNSWTEFNSKTILTGIWRMHRRRLGLPSCETPLFLLLQSFSKTKQIPRK